MDLTDACSLAWSTCKRVANQGRRWCTIKRAIGTGLIRIAYSVPTSRLELLALRSRHPGGTRPKRGVGQSQDRLIPGRNVSKVLTCVDGSAALLECGRR